MTWHRACINDNHCIEVTWTKATHCGSVQCVEVAWTKSTASLSTGTCIETAHHNGEYLIRDSKNPQQEPLRFTKAEWDAFTTGIRNGDFDNLTNE